MAGVEKITSVFDLIKIENTIFVLPFVYIGMILSHHLTVWVFVFVTLALILARGAAFSANRYFGYEIDKKNPKKKSWSSVNIYSKNELVVIFAVFALLFEISAYELNVLSAILAPFVLLIVILEPRLKKYTAHRHLVMGLVIGLGILGGYVGGAGTIPNFLAIYILLLGYMAFSAGSDIMYTLNYVDFDKKNGLHTYPVKYGVNLAKQISKYIHYWASALFIEFGALLSSPIIVIAGLITLVIFFFEHRNLSGHSLATRFFYYNAAISILMLVASFIALPK